MIETGNALRYYLMYNKLQREYIKRSDKLVRTKEYRKKYYHRKFYFLKQDPIKYKEYLKKTAERKRIIKIRKTEGNFKDERKYDPHNPTKHLRVNY